ncbi:MAG: hypothetical protein KC996_03680 [Phycisphaerales bacterium]|nr:hypothetical protein [Phycisphaerales bacterium]
MATNKWWGRFLSLEDNKINKVTAKDIGSFALIIMLLSPVLWVLMIPFMLVEILLGILDAFALVLVAGSIFMLPFCTYKIMQGDLGWENWVGVGASSLILLTYFVYRPRVKKSRWYKKRMKWVEEFM